MNRRLVFIIGAVAIGAVGFGVLTLRPVPTLTVDAPSWQPVQPHLRAAYHVHSTRSDGSGTVEEIAQAAAASQLDVVILTDHGDGTRAPSARYLHGVLCIEAVEVNTADGHVVALGMRPSPYPLAGTARAVVDDIHRLGGMAIAAHPDSPRTALRWRDWSVPVDGLEWLNADSEWRDDIAVALGRMLLTYRLGPPQTLAALLDRPSGTLARWDEMTRRAGIVGLAGADAHARLGLRDHTPDGDAAWQWKIPSYEASFQTFSMRLIPEQPLTGEADSDARLVLSAITRGRAYTVIDGLAEGGTTEFRLVSGTWQAQTGGILPIDGPVRAEVRVHGPRGTRLTLYRNGEPWHETDRTDFRLDVPAEPSVWRLEARVPTSPGQPPTPWLVTNPVYLDTYAEHRRAAAVAQPPGVIPMGLPVASGVTEQSPAALSALRPRAVIEGREVSRWDFSLSPRDSSPYAALVIESLDLTGTDRLLLRAQADQPMRLSVQLRHPSDSGDGERWGSSVYIDQTDREYAIPLSGFRPIGDAAAAPPLDRIDRVLLVVDTVNHQPTHTGHLLVYHLAAGKR
jgi:hypothetical protein